MHGELTTSYWGNVSFMVEGIVLRHHVSKNELEVDRTKGEVIKNLHLPTNIKQLKGFLQHIGFYRRFIKNFVDDIIRLHAYKGQLSLSSLYKHM